jgi:hypothetical protein
MNVAQEIRKKMGSSLLQQSTPIRGTSCIPRGKWYTSVANGMYGGSFSVMTYKRNLESMQII